MGANHPPAPNVIHLDPKRSDSFCGPCPTGTSVLNHPLKSQPRDRGISRSHSSITCDHALLDLCHDRFSREFLA